MPPVSLASSGVDDQRIESECLLEKETTDSEAIAKAEGEIEVDVVFEMYSIPVSSKPSQQAD